MTTVQKVWIGLGVRAWKERHQNEAIHCCMTGHCSINAAIFIHLIVDKGPDGKTQDGVVFDGILSQITISSFKGGQVWEERKSEFLSSVKIPSINAANDCQLPCPFSVTCRVCRNRVVTCR